MNIEQAHVEIHETNRTCSCGEIVTLIFSQVVQNYLNERGEVVCSISGISMLENEEALKEHYETHKD